MQAGNRFHDTLHDSPSYKCYGTGLKTGDVIVKDKPAIPPTSKSVDRSAARSMSCICGTESIR